MFLLNLALALGIDLIWSLVAAPILMLTTRTLLRRTVSFSEAFWGLLLSYALSALLFYFLMGALMVTQGAGNGLLMDVLLWSIIVASAVVLPVVLIAIRVHDRSGVPIGWAGSCAIVAVLALAWFGVIVLWQMALG